MPMQAAPQRSRVYTGSTQSDSLVSLPAPLVVAANAASRIQWFGGCQSEPNDDRVAATQSNIGSAGAPPGPVRTPRYRSVALPTLQVPTYAGDLRQWQEFWDHYSATIHENTELPPIEKFKYLLTYLTGAAKRAIEGIRLADNNYEIAVITLKERFGRQELLVNEHIDQLLALSPVRSSKEVEKLRVLHDTAFPQDLAVLYRQKKKEESTQDGDTSAERTTPEARTHKATDILSFLKIQVEVREEGKQAAPSSHPCHSTMVHDDMNSPTRSAHAIPSASALVATESLQQRTLSCVLCNSRAHSLAECTADMSVEEKKARLRNSRCCYSFPEPHVQQVPTPTPNGPLRIVTRCRNDRFSKNDRAAGYVWNYFPDSNHGFNW
ncbi:hypothetical protein HPB52_024962 [Rhipicephalus sanguineus]|uniref:Gag protein n=1 Tax=Rhipicephalus sanguineus TaxID=34632 RepID=A0A9D4TDP1_RHISA|nr:hypothetical protein HPB52_024962 [Rhipicephalus sanguineus]